MKNVILLLNSSQCAKHAGKKKDLRKRRVQIKESELYERSKELYKYFKIY